MTVEKGLNKRIVLVGIRFDNGSKELLSWAIVKVSDPGDQIIVLRVCRNSDDKSKERLLLDSYLEIYKELCHIKMVDITGLILTGNSIKKTLVKEAKNRSAVALLVGTTKQSTLAGGWVSTAKYCAKHLPPTTQVMTVHNGKVVFTSSTSTTNQLHKGLEDPKPSLDYVPTRQSPSQNHSQFGDSDMSELTATTTTSPALMPTTCSERGSSATSCSSSSGELQESKHRPSLNDNNDKRMIQVQPQQKPHIRSISLQTETIPEHKPIGWPLLRKTSLPTQTALDARKMSVIQWVMNLPDRSDSPQTSSSSSNSSISSWSCVSDSCCSSKSESPVGRRGEDHCCMVVNSTDRFSVWSEMPLDELGFQFESRSSDFTWFSYDVLRNSTSQFSSGNLIGNGGCSKVYKGIFPDGKQVAVRVLMKSSKQAWKDFSSEVNIISSLKHNNITSLLGVCIENNNLISVHEFKSGGNLEENLHGSDAEKSVLSWEARYKIAIGVAEALNYLHNGLSRPVIHRDVKSSNILLSDGFEPQLSDFGLAIWGPTSSSSFETYDDVVGTFGYLAPEYFMYGKVSHKIDVYSFGVVLLELLSGKKPIASGSSKGQQSLIMWAKPILETGELISILDPNLKGEFDGGQMQRMVLAATLCLTTSARLRPDTSNILKLLKGEEPIEKWIMSHSTHEEENSITDDKEVNDDEVYVDADAHSHLNLALDDVEDDDVDEFMSCTSMEQLCNGLTFSEYLKGRWSRSSSFD